MTAGPEGFWPAGTHPSRQMCSLRDPVGGALGGVGTPC